MATGRLRLARLRNDRPRPRRDDIISFGVIPIEGARILPGRSTYREVRPDRPLKPASIAVHGLRPADLEEASALGMVVDDLRDALAGRYVLAWAAEIEAAFLAKVFGRRSSWWRKQIVDVLRLALLVERTGERSPAGLLAHRRRRSTGRPGRASASRARRCADHGPGLPRPTAGPGTARDHDTSTAAPSQSRLKVPLSAPLVASRVEVRSGGHAGRTRRPLRSGRCRRRRPRSFQWAIEGGHHGVPRMSWSTEGSSTAPVVLPAPGPSSLARARRDPSVCVRTMG